MKLIIKRWQDGKFVKIREFSLDEVKQVRHYEEGFHLIFDHNIIAFDIQCILEFEKE